MHLRSCTAGPGRGAVLCDLRTHRPHQDVPLHQAPQLRAGLAIRADGGHQGRAPITRLLHNVRFWRCAGEADGVVATCPRSWTRPVQSLVQTLSQQTNKAQPSLG